MRSTQVNFKTDVIFHALFFVAQLAVLIPGGFLQQGPIPPLIVPCWLVLAALTIFRIQEVTAVFQTRSILIPAITASVIYGLILINEFTRDLWAFAIPRHYPTVIRILWYQTGLLLIHPEVYPAVWAFGQRIFRQLESHGYFGRKVWITALAAFALLWLTRSQYISSDGYDWLVHSVYPKHWVLYLREPFGTFLFFLFVQAGRIFFHWTPYVSITVLNILCGLAATILLRRIFRFAIPRLFTGVMALLLLTSYGYTQVFAGNIEIYALLQLGLLLFFYSVVRHLEGQWPLWSVGFIFGGLFCLHLSTGWWIPAFLAIPYLKKAYSKNEMRYFRDLSILTLAAATFAIPFGLFVLGYGYAWNFPAMWTHFWGDEVMTAGTDAAMFRPLSDAVSFDYYVAMCNEYFCMMPGIVVLLGVFLVHRVPWREWTPFQRWISILTGMYLIYSITWHPDRSFPGDWDLFSALTPLVLLFVSQWMAKVKLSRDAVYYLIYQATVFSGSYLILQLIYNHFRTTEWPIF